MGKRLLAGVGGFILDGVGVSILSFSGHVDTYFVNKAKVLASQFGLHEANHMNMKLTMVEGNSLCVITWAKGTYIAPWYLLDEVEKAP